MRINNDNNLIISVDRKDLFYSSYSSIMEHSPKEFKNKMKIFYLNEIGIDCGGLLRDFFYNISKEIGNSKYSLFQYSNEDTYELEINPESGIDHLKYYKFIGRILGLAILNKQYITINFNLVFFKKLLNRTLFFSDLKFVDPNIYKNLNWLKENKGAENLCLTFEVDTVDSSGNHKNIELKPNGASIDVTDSNKNEYINLVMQHKLHNANDEKKFEAIKEGFYEIIPKNINSIFDEYDLKYLMTGSDEINVDDWENNTDYEGYNKHDITILNFWKLVRSLSTEKRKKLLLFATGNSQVPVTGFKDLQGNGKIQHFKLKKVGSQNDLPVSHTCFNRIDLPPYNSYTHLKQKLLYAVVEGMGEFSIE